jgi:hypothetical protein
VNLNLYVTVYTPVGVFNGAVNGVPCTEEELVKVRDAIQNSIHTLSHLTIYHKDGFQDTREITFPQNLISNSVFAFSIGAAETDEDEEETE